MMDGSFNVRFASLGTLSGVHRQVKRNERDSRQHGGIDTGRTLHMIGLMKGVILRENLAKLL